MKIIVSHTKIDNLASICIDIENFDNKRNKMEIFWSFVEEDNIPRSDNIEIIEILDSRDIKELYFNAYQAIVEYFQLKQYYNDVQDILNKVTEYKRWDYDNIQNSDELQMLQSLLINYQRYCDKVMDWVNSRDKSYEFEELSKLSKNIKSNINKAEHIIENELERLKGSYRIRDIIKSLIRLKDDLQRELNKLQKEQKYATIMTVSALILAIIQLVIILIPK